MVEHSAINGGIADSNPDVAFFFFSDLPKAKNHSTFPEFCQETAVDDVLQNRN